MADFKPVLYLKASCPFCLKTAAFLSEIGMFAEMDVREFWPDEPEEATIRAEIDGKVEKVTFPALQHAPGEFLTESDMIIDRFAKEAGVDPLSLPFFNYVLEGPFRRMREQFAEIKRRNEQVSAG